MRDYIEVELKSGKWVLITAIDTTNRTCTAKEYKVIETFQVNASDFETPLSELYFRQQNPLKKEILLLDENANRQYLFVNHLGERLKSADLDYVKSIGGWGELKEIRTDLEGNENVVEEYFLNTLTAPFKVTCSLRHGQQSQTFDTFEEALDFHIEGMYFKTINGINSGFSTGKENSGRNPNKLRDYSATMAYLERSEL